MTQRRAERRSATAGPGRQARRALRRRKVLPWILGALIALLDATVASNLSLGVLYFFPVVLGARALSPPAALALAALCVVARVVLGPLSDPLGFADAGISLPEELRPLLATILVGASYLAIAGLLLQERRIRGLISDAETDPLTGLSNRRALDRALRPDPRVGAAGLLVLDIDHFKRINDRLGHEAGDRVLAEVAARTRALLRPEDLVARFGGEEFVAVLQEGSREAALEVAERLCEEIRRVPVAVDGEAVGVTVSIGVAHGVLGAGLLVQADRALYAAKEGGRDRVVAAEPSGAP